jgi:hypothetical protein
MEKGISTSALGRNMWGSSVVAISTGRELFMTRRAKSSLMASGAGEKWSTTEKSLPDMIISFGLLRSFLKFCFRPLPPIWLIVGYKS